MQIRLLGHVEASVDERPVALGGVKQRAVLAMLGLEANRLVSADRLIEGLWGEAPPPSAAKMVQNYVWRLRKALDDDGGAEIVTHGRGYELQIDRELIDALRFERLVGEASRGVAGDAARQALALYRGEPLADIAQEPFAGAEIRRLEELYVTAAELAIDADLAAGRHQEVLGEIERLLAEYELRERLHGQRLLALYRSGRQADALAAYRQARAMLVEQIGVEPGPELQRLHAAILRHDPALTVETPALELPEELGRAAAAPLIARERELTALRRLWRAAAAGDGAVVTIVGVYGMGKSRVAAELAREVHGQGATVLYAAGGGPGEAALATIARAADARRPTLLVLDDADRAPVDVRLAVRKLGDGGHPVLALATGTRTAALARLEPGESLELAPLAEGAVGAIAALYAPPGSEIPSAELLAGSRGVPRRVHEAASQWAQREASDRVDALATRAAAGRSETRALESELAGSVADLRSTRERIQARPATSGVLCPYKGLASFDADDAEYFFGREGLVAELVARLVGARLLAVVGPSGSGKSSVLRAGLLPALAEGVLPGSEHWAQAVMRPGAHPLRELRGQRLQQRGLLVVDQFEELFTACPDERERAEFVAAVLAAPRAVVAVRADFYGRCAAYPELSRALAGNHVLVGPMTREELRRAIERPAQRAGLVVEPELTELLLADVEGEAGALPLLSTTLLELWGSRDGRRLRPAAYARAGGVQGAVARLAEDAFVALDPQQQAAARTLFLRLGDEDEGGMIVRRRIALGEQDAAVVARLTERRLLTVSDGTVEVAHEALLHEWPRLRRWLDEDTESRRLHRRLREAARSWEADGREAGGLYRGARLAAARDWAARHDDELEPGERAFLAAARRASGAAQRRLWAGLAGMGALLVLALIAGTLAVHQRDQARTGETSADAQRLGAQALATDDLELSLLLARQAVALRDTTQTRADLFAALLKSPAAIGVIRGVGHPTGLMLAPGGRLLVATTQENVLRLVDTATGTVAGPARTLGDVTDDTIVFDPRGARVATNTSNASIRDAHSWTPLVTLQDATWVFNEAFSADGRELFTLQEAPSKMTALLRYDALTGLPIGKPRLLPNGANLPEGSAVLALRHGHRIVTLVSGRVALRDARTLAALWTLDDPALRHVAVSPDDRTLLLGGNDGAVTFVDLPSGTVHRLPGREQRAVLQVAFSPDGHTAATAGADDRILLWDVARRTVRETLAGHTATITGLVFGSDGRTLYSSGLDGRILSWDVAGHRRLGRPFTLAPGPAAPALSPDGRTLAVAHGDGTVSLLGPATLRARTLRVSDEALGGVAFTDGHHLLATAPGDRRSPAGYGVVIDTRTGRLGPRVAGLGSLRAPSVDADGRRVALVWHGAAMVQPLAAGRPAGHPRWYRRSGGALSAVLSPDGRTLAVGTHNGIEIVDVASMHIRGFLVDSETADTAPRFLHGGRLVAAGSRDGWVRLWSAATSKPASPRLAAHLGPVVALAVSPDGHTLATGGTDGSVRLFDLDTRQPLDARLPVAPNRAATPVFSRDGAFLLVLTPSGRDSRWDLRPSAWIRRACAVAGRRLTPSEWSQVLPDRAYHPGC